MDIHSRIKLLSALAFTALLGACGGAASSPSTASPGAGSHSASVSSPASSPAGPTSASGNPASRTATSAQAAASAPTAKLTVVLPSTTIALAPAYMAAKNGFWKAEGLDVDLELAGSGSKTAAAVVGGSAQFGGSDLGDLIGAVAKGQDIRIFAALNDLPDYYLVLRKSVADRLGINEHTPLKQRLAALKGLKLAISTPGSGTDSMMRYLLRLGGLNPERDVTILTTGSVVNSLAAYVNGAADGASLSPPSEQRAVLQHGAIALVNTSAGDVPELQGQVQNGLWATGKWLDANPQLAAKAVAGLWKTLDYIHHNDQQASAWERQAAFKELDPQVYALSWKGAVATFAQTPAISQDGIQKLIDFQSQVHGQQLKLKPADFSTNKYVELAQKQLKS